MQQFLNHLVREADGGGGGTGSAPASAGAAPDAGAATPGTQPDAAAPSPEAAPVADYWPDGLDVKLKGADAKGTLDNLAKALGGYRDRDAKLGRVEKAEDYLDFSSNMGEFKIDGKNQPYFDVLGKDPAFRAIADVAFKHGVGKPAMLSMYQAALNAMGEAGVLEPVIDAKAENAKLVPDAAKGLPAQDQAKAVEARIKGNFDFLDLMVANKGLPQEARLQAELMLGDTAAGHGFLEWIKGLVQGGTESGGPASIGQPGGGVTLATVQAKQAKLNEMQPGTREYTALSKEIDAEFQALYPPART